MFFWGEDEKKKLECHEFSILLVWKKYSIYLKSCSCYWTCFTDWTHFAIRSNSSGSDCVEQKWSTPKESDLKGSNCNWHPAPSFTGSQWILLVSTKHDSTWATQTHVGISINYMCCPSKAAEERTSTSPAEFEYVLTTDQISSVPVRLQCCLQLARNKKIMIFEELKPTNQIGQTAHKDCFH